MRAGGGRDGGPKKAKKHKIKVKLRCNRENDDFLFGPKGGRGRDSDIEKGKTVKIDHKKLQCETRTKKNHCKRNGSGEGSRENTGEKRKRNKTSQAGEGQQSYLNRKRSEREQTPQWQVWAGTRETGPVTTVEPQAAKARRAFRKAEVRIKN